MLRNWIAVFVKNALKNWLVSCYDVQNAFVNIRKRKPAFKGQTATDLISVSVDLFVKFQTIVIYNQ